MTNSQTWQPAALGRFLALSAAARGLSATCVSYSDRLTQLLVERREFERVRQELRNFAAWSGVDTQRVLARIAAHDSELARLAAQIEPIEAARAAAWAKRENAGALATRCGETLVKLGLLSPEEVYL